MCAYVQNAMTTSIVSHVLISKKKNKKYSDERFLIKPLISFIFSKKIRISIMFIKSCYMLMGYEIYINIQYECIYVKIYVKKRFTQIWR